MPLSRVSFKKHPVEYGELCFSSCALSPANVTITSFETPCVLKLFAWETAFMESISSIRVKEAITLRKLAFVNGTVAFLWICAPFLVAISCFVTFVLIDEKNVLDPSTAFVSLTLFNTLRTNLAAIPQLVTEIAQSCVSFKRVTDFLLSEELEGRAPEVDIVNGNAVEIDGGTFCWTKEEPPFLRDISLSVRQGSLVAVVGPVGAGKSALFSAILGEMHAAEGTVQIMKNSHLAYVPQQAWIQNATLRQNILFVKPMDRTQYDLTLSRCCLKPDLKILPGGDLTEIGEKVNSDTYTSLYHFENLNCLYSLFFFN
ncbi:Canalicular multispecific organic anion transporter 2 [Araneus ventricosus]|uniref:Canalicular multispecific organic anion transporter 2 n=1 Tax=Araneus ventricosus TaxID=182803 RepID=A0A4Y2WEC0_ARAVE|nr:Canalicular multispecific organic anion transporter 2 [Araneus ventricosus]